MSTFMKIRPVEAEPVSQNKFSHFHTTHHQTNCHKFTFHRLALTALLTQHNYGDVSSGHST